LNQVKAGGRAAPTRKNQGHSSVDSCIFGTTVLNFWIADKYDYSRTLQDCVRNPNTDYSLFYIQTGTAEICQCNRKAHIRSGDCFFVNMAEPLTFVNVENLRFTTVHIEVELMKSLIPAPQNLTAILLTKHSLWAAALAATLRALTPRVIELPFFTQKDVFGHICCLLSLAISEAGHNAKDNKASMLNRFRKSIYEKFYKPRLSPKNVAEEHKVSIRTLHSVFAKAGSSFGQELLALRMDRAAHLLRDPRFNNKSIADIGVLVGFTHPSHFTTRFNAAHGITPSAFRAREQADFNKGFVKR